MRQFTLHIICINFQVVFFGDNFRECATLNAFHEEIFKLHFLLNQGRSIFLKKERCRLRHTVLLFSLVSYSSSSCHATRSQTQFSVKELAIAKSIFELPVKQIRRNYRQCRLFLGLARTTITPHNSPRN